MDKNKILLLEEIKKAEKAKNFDAMLLAAQKAYAIYPEDKTFASRVHDAQAEYVNDKLSSKLLLDLEQKEDWQGLLAIYEKLLTIFPESARLQNLLKKAHTKIVQAQEKARKEYFKNAQKTIGEMVKKGELDDAEQACYEMLALDENNKQFIRLLAHIQHLQDKVMNKLLGVYFKEVIPALKTEYKAHKEDFIRV